MGGEHSGVSETTTDVLIECAYFDPEHIARTGQKLGLTSDARTRFERGVDPAFLDDGLAIATHLVSSICGGTAERDHARGHAADGAQRDRLRSRARRNARRRSPSPRPAAQILESLGFTRGSAAGPSPCRAGAATSMARPIWSRKSSASRASTRSRPCRCPRAPGVARPTATAEQKLERRAAPRRRRARAERSGHLELHLREPRPRPLAAAPGRSPTRSART